MQKQNFNKQKMDTASIIFMVLLFITMLIVIFIQLSIIISYIMTTMKGRCVFINSDNNCECRTTTKKSCDSVKGIYNGNLTCEDGFASVCDALEDIKPTSAPTF